MTKKKKKKTGALILHFNKSPKSSSGKLKEKIYHISDEFFKEVFQKFLRREQRGLVQLLLPQVVVIVHWL